MHNSNAAWAQMNRYHRQRISGPLPGGSGTTPGELQLNSELMPCLLLACIRLVGLCMSVFPACCSLKLDQCGNCWAFTLQACSLHACAHRAGGVCTIACPRTKPQFRCGWKVHVMCANFSQVPAAGHSAEWLAAASSSSSCSAASQPHLAAPRRWACPAICA